MSSKKSKDIEKHVKEINKKKIKSIREILDLNNDGKVSKKEYKESFKDSQRMEKLKNISPMDFILMSKNLSMDEFLKQENQVNLVRRAIKANYKDKHQFDVRFIGCKKMNGHC